SDDDGNYDVAITEIKPGENEKAGPYSVMLLFDQSGSISDTDPGNARIDAGKAFVDIMGNSDEAALAVFPHSEPYSDFTQDKTHLKDLIETMRNNNGGGTPLFSSIYGHLDYVCHQSKNDNKAIIVFTDGQDSNTGFIQNIIDTAKQCDIAVYTIGLGDENSLDFEFLALLATGTGGAVMYAQDALQLITLYNSLSDFLHGDGSFYETCWEARKVNGQDWISGELFFTTIYLKLPTGEFIQYPVQLIIP
ncbi:MAG TPA: VWA domain-containing protein, partial [Phaeodactylibacter sp.]|nr:VWA domain-containing protein [Phaeodactylibacter sp.]